MVEGSGQNLTDEENKISTSTIIIVWILGIYINVLGVLNLFDVPEGLTFFGIVYRCIIIFGMILVSVVMWAIGRDIIIPIIQPK